MESRGNNIEPMYVIAGIICEKKGDSISNELLYDGLLNVGENHDDFIGENLRTDKSIEEEQEEIIAETIDETIFKLINRGGLIPFDNGQNFRFNFGILKELYKKLDSRFEEGVKEAAQELDEFEKKPLKISF